MADHDIRRELLTQIDRNPAISQKKLSEEIGISVGMINWHVKRCVNKGLIKLQQAPVRRYLYYLTPEGFAEKAKLTAGYLQSSFNIFQKGREQYGALFSLCEANGWTTIIFLGDTELAELALLVSSQHPDLKILGILEGDPARQMRGHVPVFKSYKDIRKTLNGTKPDAAIACHYLVSFEQDTDIKAFLKDSGLDQSRLLVPGFLQ